MVSKALAQDTKDYAWTAKSVAKSIRWLPPERIRHYACLTYEGDVYSFAMTALECITRQRPFAEFDDDDEIRRLYKHILDNGRPERPKTKLMSDRLWHVIKQCWAAYQKDRPSMHSVVSNLGLLMF